MKDTKDCVGNDESLTAVRLAGAVEETDSGTNSNTVQPTADVEQSNELEETDIGIVLPQVW